MTDAVKADLQQLPREIIDEVCRIAGEGAAVIGDPRNGCVVLERFAAGEEEKFKCLYLHTNALGKHLPEGLVSKAAEAAASSPGHHLVPYKASPEMVHFLHMPRRPTE